MADEAPEGAVPEKSEEEQTKEDKPEEADASKDENAKTPEPPPEKAPAPKPKTQDKGPASGDCVSPTPSGEELPQEESNKIIQLTVDILQHCQKKVDDQKIGSHSMSFMLLRIKESLDAYYNDYIPKLNTFLVNADQITAEYYGNMCQLLPEYGDYVKAIQSEEGEKVDIGLASPVMKQEALELVKGVTDNYYAAAMFLRSGRLVYKDVNSGMPERKDMVLRFVKNIPEWMQLQDKVTTQLEDIREQTFKISAYLDFLKQGESKIAPTLDLSALNQSTNYGDTSQIVTPQTNGNQTATD